MTPTERERDGESFENPSPSMWDFDAWLPLDRETAVSMGEGGTPLLSAPDPAANFGVDRLVLKDEGQNPTGSVTDRELSMAVTAAMELGVEAGSLAAPGAAGQSFAAYAARAGLEGSVYLPSRAPFINKAMCNVHGIELTVVPGRLDAATAALESERTQESLGYPFGAFETPFRYVGASTMAFEIVAAMDDGLPDAVVVPTGDTVPLVGLYEGFHLLETHEIISKTPPLVAVQPAGCAPIVDAVNAGNPPQPVSVPDTICGELEVADPAGGTWAIQAIANTGGTAVAVTDEEILDAGGTIARTTGIEVRPDAAAGPAGVQALRENGFLSRSATVLTISTGTGGADVLKSHLDASGR
ncbi:MAG: pyridoxal-phosphate dependent enzyme [Halodesulfurarchaeum sp.]